MSGQWVKLWTDILGDPKLLRSSRRGLREIELLPWLIAFAKQADDDGRLSINGEAADPEDVAVLLPGVRPKRVATCFASLLACGVLTTDPDGVLRFTSWDRRAGTKPSDSPSAISERVKRHREARRNAEGVTPCNALQVTGGNATEEEEEKEEEKEEETKGSRRAAGASRKPRAAKAKAEPAPWMGDVRRVWQAQFPGSEPKRGAAESLRPAMRDHGPDVVLPRLAVYLRKVGAQHLNLNTFAGTVLAPDWAPEGERPASAVPVSAGSADDLLAAMEGAGLVVAFSGPREVYRERIAALGEKLGRPAEEFRALVTQVRPWDLATITFPPDRRREFARRLAAASAKVAA